ncbi:MAG: hypothetical protein O3C20_01420 [Verrucomicrobia bacterium]|nr:hypothetical protein [Verrucomicrobiota bacterium]
MSPNREKSSRNSFKVRWANGLEISVVVLLIILFVNLFSWPKAIVDETLDGSWQAILTFSMENGYEFGDDLVFTYGPLGGLSSFSYSGYNHAGKYAFELFARVCMVVFFFRFLRHLRTYSKIGCILLYLFILQLLPNNYETFFFFGILSWVAAMLHEPMKKNRSPWALLFLGVAFLVFCSLIKFTLLVAGLFCLVMVIFFFLYQRRYVEAIVLAATYPGGFAILWVVLGQSLGGVPGFLYGSYQVAKGYSMSMQLATEPQSIKFFLLFLFTGVVLLSILVKDQLQAHKNKPFVGKPWFILTIIYAGLFFMVWKQGVVRSDGHIWQFFCYVPLAGWFLYPILKQKSSLLMFDVTILLQSVVMIAALATYYPNVFLDSPKKFWDNTRYGINGLLKPSGMLNELAAKLDSKGKALFEQYPLLQQVGDRSVDVVGHGQGLAIIPGLNYKPRPVFQDYVANNAYLQKINEAYWESANTPDVVIQALDAIDGNSPAHADSQTKLHLLSHYTLEAEDGNLVLLKRKEIPSRLVRGEEVRYSLKQSEQTMIDNPKGQFLLGRIEMPLNMLGRLRAFFYKPPIVHLNLLFPDGSTRDYRLNPSTTELDYLLSPAAQSAPELWHYRRGAAFPELAGVTLRVDSFNGFYFKKNAALIVTPIEWVNEE